MNTVCDRKDCIKRDCRLFDEDKVDCRGLKKLYCANGKKCNFYDNGKTKKRRP